MPNIFPEQGLSFTKIKNEIEQLKQKDVQWKSGKSFCLSYFGGEEADKIAKEVIAEFSCDNALNPTAFPSLNKMENEVVMMVKEVLGGDQNSRGTMTTGGTESILLAVKTAREWAKTNRNHVTKPNIIVPNTIHPAFNKACHYFGIEMIEVKVDPVTFKPSILDYKQKLNDQTILLVGSAPSYPHGVIDPIEDIALLAHQQKILCHVDACIGGFVLGFYQKLGLNVPQFDLSTKGVTSISCDLHKYGFTPKGASVVLYKDAELRKNQFFCTTAWPGGVYISPSILGSRSGGPIAAAWAIMKSFGIQGYKDKFQKVHDITHQFHDAINGVDGLETITHSPEASILAISSKECNIFRLADLLSEKGWCFDRNTSPESIHLTIMPGHEEIFSPFMEDLKNLFAVAKKEHTSSSKLKQSVMKSFIKIAPKNLVQTLAKQQTKQVADEDSSSETASIYGLMGSLNKKGALKDIAIDLMDKLYKN